MTAFTSIALGCVLSLVAGALIKLFLDKTGSHQRITGIEYVIGALISCLVVAPATTTLGEKLVVGNKLSFNEYWNGWEVDATEDVRTCHQDGVCRNTYSCDPYQVPEVYYTYDSKGNATPHTRMVTKWHSCPVGTEEADYVIHTTLGDIVVARGHYTPNTQPWRAGRALDGPTERPAKWVAARERLDAGKPGGVTNVHKYDNYILASQDAVLAKYSDSITGYQAAGLLPDPVAGASRDMRADKAYFVGKAPEDAQAWQDAVRQVNAAVGYLAEGDLHLVLVDTREVTNPDDYAAALLAHWQSPDLGDNAASKNTVVIIAATKNGRTVDWARAGTGMPIGNERFIKEVAADLEGAPWTPQGLVGSASAKVRNGDVEDEDITVEPAAITDAIFATDGTGFKRVPMTSEKDDDDAEAAAQSGDKAEGESGNIGYEYLLTQIRPTTAQYATMTLVGLVLSIAVWAGFVAFESSPYSPVASRRERSRGRVDPYYSPSWSTRSRY